MAPPPPVPPQRPVAPSRGRLWRAAAPLLLVAAVLAGAPAQAASRGRIQKTAQLTATDPAGTWMVAVAPGGDILLGTARLETVGRIGGEAAGAIVRDGVAAVWTGRREGLAHQGQLLRVDAAGAVVVHNTAVPLLSVAIDEAGVVWATVPGGLLRVDGQGVQARGLPVDAPRFVAQDGDQVAQATLAVGFGDRDPLAIDPATGCAALPPVDRWPFADPLLVARLDAARCTRDTALPPRVGAASRFALEAARLAAWRSGDALASWALGSPENGAEDDISDGDWTGHKPKVVVLDRRAAGGLAGPVAVVRTPLASAGPAAWVGDPGAAACHGGVVLVVSDHEQRAAWTMALKGLRRAGADCVDGLRLVDRAPLAAAGELSAESSVVYADADGKLVGERSGRAGPTLVRDDLVKLAGAGDPLYAMASAPALSPGWTRAPGPGSAILVDVDGSIVMGLGHGLLRNTAKGHRPQVVPLPGPVQSVRLNERSVYEVVVAGQRAEVVFEAGHMRGGSGVVTWDQDGPLLTAPAPPPPVAPLAGWMISGTVVQAPESGAPVELGAPVRRVVAWTGGAAVLTTRGVVGLFPDGGVGWRIPEATDVQVVDELVIAALPWGAAGYRAPLRRPTAVARPEPEPTEEAGPGGGGPGGGGPGGGGPGGGGPGGGGPGGGGPGGGGPGGGGPGGGGPGGGGPGGGGPGGGGPGGGAPGGGG